MGQKTKIGKLSPHIATLYIYSDFSKSWRRSTYFARVYTEARNSFRAPEKIRKLTPRPSRIFFVQQIIHRFSPQHFCRDADILTSTSIPQQENTTEYFFGIDNRRSHKRKGSTTNEINGRSRSRMLIRHILFLLSCTPLSHLDALGFSRSLALGVRRPLYTRTPSCALR